MTGLQTKPELLEALKKSAKTKMTPEEHREQRISFIMGSLDDKSGMTREQVSRVLAEQNCQ